MANLQTMPSPLSPESASALQSIRAQAGSGRVVFVSGTFNIVHPGHLRLLRFAAECGDYLVVGVYADGLAANAQLTEEMRVEGVAAISWVKHAFVLRDPPATFVAHLHPTVVVKGREHEGGENPELEVLQSYGGTLLFGSGDTTFSSLDLIRRETSAIDHGTIIRPVDFLGRHQIDLAAISSTLEQMRSLRVCVIGDTIVDDYIQCDPLGMSQEDPTIVVTPILTKRFIGGAAIVSAHARHLGAKSVDFLSVVGEDEAGRYVAENLERYDVDAELVQDNSRPTTLKQRYRAGNKTLLRVSHLRQHKIDRKLQSRLMDRLKAKLAETDLLVFSDFNYGALPQELVDQITRECKRRDIMMVADSQSSSQFGDVSRFKGVQLLTPTEREARIAMGNYEDGLVVIAESLRQRADAENIAITLGAEGVLIHAKITDQSQWLTDRLAALNSAPKDVAGAGDCLLVCSAMALAVGRPVWEAMYLGSLAAACQVARVGNIPLGAAELLVEIEKSNNAGRG